MARRLTDIIRESDDPQINAEKQNQKEQQRDYQGAGGEEAPLNGIKKDSPRVYPMPEFANHH